MHEEVKAHIEKTREALRETLKLHPKFAVDHPEVYRLFGLAEEAKKATKNYQPVEYNIARQSKQGD